MSNLQKNKTAPQSSPKDRSKRQKGRNTLENAWLRKAPASNHPDDMSDDASPPGTPAILTMTNHAPSQPPNPTPSPTLRTEAVSDPTQPRLPDSFPVPPPPTDTNNHPRPGSSTTRIQTPPRSNRRPTKDHHFEFRLTVPASDPNRALQMLLNTLTKILAKLWEADAKVRILPWYANSSAQPLTSAADIPTSVSLL